MSDQGARKIVFTSGKGGVGKSTLISAIGRRLHDQGLRVLLMDCDMGLRSLDIMMSLSHKTVYDWGDVLAGRISPHGALIQEDGPALLAAPLEYVDITPQRMRELVHKYDDAFDFIFIDAPAGIGLGFELAIAMANEAVVVCTPDTVCTRSVHVAAEHLLDAGLEPRLLINRFKKKGVKRSDSLNIDAVIDQTGTRLVGIVPEDEAFAVSVLHGEKPAKTSKSIRALDRIIKRMNGENLRLRI